MIFWNRIYPIYLSAVCLILKLFDNADSAYTKLDGKETGGKEGFWIKRNDTDEEKLMSKLFKSYRITARPVLNSSDPVQVHIQFSLMHIKDLDIRSQILTTTGLLILEWTDERLVWDPDEHNNLTEIVMEAESLWKPEFAVINGAEKIYETYNQFRAVISHKGRIHWEPGGVFKTMCAIDVTYYPFDEQKCALKFGAWSYSTNKMNLTVVNDSTSFNLDSYRSNGEWSILSTNVTREEFSYNCCPDDKFSNVVFEVELRRRHLFYLMNIIAPSIMTSVLLLSVFFCTPGQKVQIGVVVLLSFGIFLLNVAENIPKTSDHIPLLVIYLTFTLAITTLSVVLTVLVLNLHAITDRPVPNWVRVIVLVLAARVMGMCDTARLYSISAATPPAASKRRPMSGGLIGWFISKFTNKRYQSKRGKNLHFSGEVRRYGGCDTMECGEKSEYMTVQENQLKCVQISPKFMTSRLLSNVKDTMTEDSDCDEINKQKNTKNIPSSSELTEFFEFKQPNARDESQYESYQHQKEEICQKLQKRVGWMDNKHERNACENLKIVAHYGNDPHTKTKRGQRRVKPSSLQNNANVERKFIYYNNSIPSHLYMNFQYQNNTDTTKYLNKSAAVEERNKAIKIESINANIKENKSVKLVELVATFDDKGHSISPAVCVSNSQNTSTESTKTISNAEKDRGENYSKSTVHERSWIRIELPEKYQDAFATKQDSKTELSSPFGNKHQNISRIKSLSSTTNIDLTRTESKLSKFSRSKSHDILFRPTSKNETTISIATETVFRHLSDSKIVSLPKHLLHEDCKFTRHRLSGEWIVKNPTDRYNLKSNCKLNSNANAKLAAPVEIIRDSSLEEKLRNKAALKERQKLSDLKDHGKAEDFHKPEYAQTSPSLIKEKNKNMESEEQNVSVPKTKSDNGKTPDYSGDWKRVAEVSDRIFFWVFFFAIILSTVALFRPLLNVND